MSRGKETREYGAYVVLPGDDKPTKWAESDNRAWIQALVEHKRGAGLDAEVREITRDGGA